MATSPTPDSTNDTVEIGMAATEQLAAPTSRKPVTISQPKLLLGEGREEELFFTALLKDLGLADIQVIEYGGKDRLAGRLRTLVRESGFPQVRSIAVTRDADSDATEAFQDICVALIRAELPAPTEMKQFTSTSPRVGVFVLPDCLANGMLEDLCLTALQDDSAVSCVNEFIGCLQKAGPAQPTSASEASKARIHAWLTSRNLRDRRLGRAAELGHIPWGNPTFEPFTRFLRML